MSDIHNRLRGWNQHEQLGHPSQFRRTLGDHRNRVDDRRGVEHRLQNDFPNMRDITEIHVQRGQHQSHAECDRI